YSVAMDQTTSTTIKRLSAIVTTRQKPIVMETPLAAAATKEIRTLACEFSGRQAGLYPSGTGWRKGFAGAMLSLPSVCVVNRSGGWCVSLQGEVDDDAWAISHIDCAHALLPNLLPVRAPSRHGVLLVRFCLSRDTRGEFPG